MGEACGRSATGPLHYDRTTWRSFVDRARDRVDGGSLGAAVRAAAAGEGLSDSGRAQLAFYLTTEIENEYAADADQLSANTFDMGATDAPIGRLATRLALRFGLTGPAARPGDRGDALEGLGERVDDG